jgi:hypothetical protein
VITLRLTITFCRSLPTTTFEHLGFSVLGDKAFASSACVDKSEGKWIELDANSDRIVNQDYGAKLDAERQRKRDVIGGRKINPS